jgi:hypothetical protein
MSTTNASVNTSGSSLFGTGIPAQILIALLAGLILFIVLFSIESFIKTINRYANAKTVLVPDTVTSNRTIVFRQSPSDPKVKMILPSENELTGVEFTYSFFLFIEPSSFDGSDRLKQVFYKGYSAPFPLLGPGVFLKGDANTMRIFMNSYKNWYSYVDVPNVPVQKWFHVGIVFRKNNLEVYVNANLKGRIPMEDTYPYQNYQDLIVFGGTNYTNPNSLRFKPLVGDAETYKVGGSMNGRISRLYYYRYALSFAELNGNANQGPSAVIQSAPDETYYLQNSLTDTWYTAGQ